MSSSIDPQEKTRAFDESVGFVDFYSEALKVSTDFRKDYDNRLNVVKGHQMPLERSPDGLVKHIINERMNTKECCLDLFMQIIEAGKATGKSRHLSEEVMYVIEGEGHDLHWDVRFDCDHEMEFTWDEEPKKFEWSQGDFIYIPPYCAHKRFNTGTETARCVVVNSRILKPMGFDWCEQLENAEGF
jgi:uncharacterized RmlC-like cupin family protein